MSERSIQSTGEGLEILHQISQMLDTGLDKETLTICVQLLDLGVNAEALANVIKDLQREVKIQSAGESETSLSKLTLKHKQILDEIEDKSIFTIV